MKVIILMYQLIKMNIIGFTSDLRFNQLYKKLKGDKKMPNRSIVLIVLVLLISGCSSKETGRYYNTKDDFSLKFPKDWENREGFMGTDVISLSPKENAGDQFRENVNVVVEPLPDGMDLNGYFNANIPKLSGVVRDFQQNGTGSAIINNTRAEWLIYTGSIGSITLKAKQYYLVNGNKGYVITCSATPSTYDAYNSIFDTVVNSFQFEQ
jgi:hypothetical protein